MKSKNYLLPLSVRMLVASIFENSSNSYNKGAVFSDVALFKSLRRASQSLLSVADLSDVVK